ncbi:hypothetical protein GH714_001657 [Hevea brasiliensis]|uniref:Uncharacterized protein n=1 Tax=Hevea brasiliensis TaxID=3981 RepID=A0A6A6M7U5_HEVBR|nr:hypothetical protein GH714_001657 [Hevea brasiliensis]
MRRVYLLPGSCWPQATQNQKQYPMAEDTIDSFLFYTLHLIASRNLNHIQQNKMILGAWVHQMLEQQMPSSDIPSKILCQVIKIDLQDMQQQTPCQQLIPKDLHGNEWHFQHVNQISLFVNCYFALKAWNAQNGGPLAILVLDDKNEQMITMDTPEEENADADYLPRCIRALYTMLSLVGSTRISKWVIDNFIRYKSLSCKPQVDGKMNELGPECLR